MQEKLKNTDFMVAATKSQGLLVWGTRDRWFESSQPEICLKILRTLCVAVASASSCALAGCGAAGMALHASPSTTAVAASTGRLASGIWSSFAVNGYLQGIVRAKNGDFWVADGDQTSTLSRITPNGNVTVYNIGYVPLEEAMDGAGNLWLTVKPNLQEIVRVSPRLKLTLYTLHDDTAGGIMIGGDGNVWFAETSHVGRLTPDGVLTEFAVGRVEGESGIAWANGSVWFRGQWTGGAGLESVDPSNGNVVAYEAPVYDGGAIVSAKGSLWCASGSSGGALPLVQFNLKSKAVTTYDAPTAYDPYGAPGDMTLDSDGSLWYTSQRLQSGRVVGGGLVRFDIATKQFTTYASPPSYGWQWDVAAAPDGRLWATSAFAVVALKPKE